MRDRKWAIEFINRRHPEMNAATMSGLTDEELIAEAEAQWVEAIIEVAWICGTELTRAEAVEEMEATKRANDEERG